MTEIAIRPLARIDRAQWQPLWQSYLAFYKTSVPDEVIDTTFSRFFDESEPMHALIAERDGKMVGIVHYIFHRSTWTEGPYCYLQDLFTAERRAAAELGVSSSKRCTVARESRGPRASIG
jgi:hypothetical protein